MEGASVLEKCAGERVKINGFSLTMEAIFQMFD
jgi:hypothetical protein